MSAVAPQADVAGVLSVFGITLVLHQRPIAFGLKKDADEHHEPAENLSPLNLVAVGVSYEQTQRRRSKRDHRGGDDVEHHRSGNPPGDGAKSSDLHFGLLVAPIHLREPVPALDPIQGQTDAPGQQQHENDELLEAEVVGVREVHQAHVLPEVAVEGPGAPEGVHEGTVVKADAEEEDHYYGCEQADQVGLNVVHRVGVQYHEVVGRGAHVVGHYVAEDHWEEREELAQLR